MRQSTDLRLSVLRRPFVAAVVAALVAVGVALLIAKGAGFARTLDALRGAEPGWLGLCLAAELIAFLGYIPALRGVVRFDRGPELDFSTSAELVFASLAATRLLAAGGAGGLALDYWALRKAGAPRYEAIVRVLALNTLLYGIFGAAAFAAALALLLGAGDGAPLGMTLPWLAVIPAFFAAAGWVTAPRRRARLGDARKGGRLRRAFAGGVAAANFVRRMVERPRENAAALAGAFLYWAPERAPAHGEPCRGASRRRARRVARSGLRPCLR